MRAPTLCFDTLCDYLTAAGCHVGIELSKGEHTIVVTADGGRILRAPVERGFDQAATVTVLALSGGLHNHWDACDIDHNGWVVRGGWPELEALVFEASA